jgi:hypothetical protein
MAQCPSCNQKVPFGILRFDFAKNAGKSRYHREYACPFCKQLFSITVASRIAAEVLVIAGSIGIFVAADKFFGNETLGVLAAVVYAIVLAIIWWIGFAQTYRP